MAFQIKIAQLQESLSKKFMESISKIREQEESQQHWTIYRIPDVIRQLCQHAYNPSVVSIGPLHRGSSHLQAMEPIKMFYFLTLTQPHGQTCVNQMLELEPRARICYAELLQFYENVEASFSHEYSTSFHPNLPPPIFDISNPSSLQECIRTKFAETMLLDGYFILELLRRDYHRKNTKASLPDQILDNDFLRLAVEQDLLRLENQIPLEVLQTLFRITTDVGRPSLHRLILSFFGEMMRSRKSDEEEMMDENSHETPPHHILHLIHRCYRPTAGYPDLSKLSEQPEFRYSATQLDLAGVKLLPGKTSNLFDLKFCTAPSYFRVFRRARLEIPPFRITYSTEALLRNLIAFEQCRDTGFRYFTSYAFLMDKLINSAEDVDLLVDAGVVQNYMGSSEEASQLFNNICRNVYVGNFYFTQPCKEVEAYCSGMWSRCMAKLKRDYFSSPWTGVSVLAAIILFTLTLMQTIYAMLSYY